MDETAGAKDKLRELLFTMCQNFVYPIHYLKATNVKFLMQMTPSHLKSKNAQIASLPRPLITPFESFSTANIVKNDAVQMNNGYAYL